MKRRKTEAEEHRDERIEKTGQLTLSDAASGEKIHLLTIIGEIEGHDNLSGNSKTTKYEHILPQLAAIEDSEEIGGVAGAFKYHGRRCGGGTGYCRDAGIFKQTHRIPGAGWQSFHRGAYCGEL